MMNHKNIVLSLKRKMENAVSKKITFAYKHASIQNNSPSCNKQNEENTQISTRKSTCLMGKKKNLFILVVLQQIYKILVDLTIL